MGNSIKGSGPPPSPYLWKKIKHFFSETIPFLSTFCKKCIFTIENPENSSKNDILLLDKQLFAFSDARFCCDMCIDGCYTQNFVRDMHNFSIDMVLSP